MVKILNTRSTPQADEKAVISITQPIEYTDKQIKTAAKAAHDANRDYCVSIGDDSQPTWKKAPKWQKESAVAGVKFHIDNPDADDAASHNSWLTQKEADGWVYGEEKNAGAKTHPCMVPFERLPEDQQFKDALFRESVWSVLAASNEG